MKNLIELSDRELKDFFNSFDLILSDIDGVVWNFIENIPGADDAIRSLQKLGKRVVFVTNNTTKSLESFSKQFKNAGFDVDPDDIVTPTHAIIAFLREQNLFDRKIFVLGMSALKEELQLAGFELAESESGGAVQNVIEFIEATTADDGTVGVVIADTDLNLNYINLQRGITLLKRPEVVFVKGAADLRLPIGLNQVLAGPGNFHNIIEQMTGRKGVSVGKPSQLLNRCIMEKYGITDKSRVLFMGDSIPQDMGFGANCGYRKFLVLSGLTRKEDLENWRYPEEFKPDFYADSLKVVHDLILRIF